MKKRFRKPQDSMNLDGHKDKDLEIFKQKIIILRSLSKVRLLPGVKI